MVAFRVALGAAALTGSMVVAAQAASAAPDDAPAAATAGTLTRVTGFGNNPGDLSMYSYVPDGLPSGAPLVVALHGCTQSAQAYHQGSGWSELADEYGFAVVYPEQSSANNANSCFNFFEPGDTTRGQGEAQSIAQMVEHARESYELADSDTHVTGLSAGGAMTSVMLATYPDLFASGSIVAGIPYRCATSMVDAFSCMSSPPDKTPQQWGDLARQGHPGYDGTRPKVSIWHGTSDTTVAPANMRESRDQFTNVLGVGQSPTATTSLPAGTTRTEYGDADVVTYSIEGTGHGTPVDPGTGSEQCGQAGAYFLDTICSARYDAAFFGLAPPVDPGDGGSEDPGDPGETVCVTNDNYAHTVEGRAHHSGGMTYANGSGDAMGLWNMFTTTTLEEIEPGHWEVGC